MSIDRILQLKLLADVSDIDSKMGSADKTVGKSVGRMTAALDKLKGFALPIAADFGMQAVGAVTDAIGAAVEQAGELRRNLDTLDSLKVSLDLDSAKIDTKLDRLWAKASNLGFSHREDITEAFTRALAVTDGKVGRSMSLVNAAMDYARLKGIDFGEAWEETFDAIIGGGDEAEEKLGVFGDTVGERLKSFDGKYGNFAEDFALTDEGQWAIVEARFEGHMLNLGILLDGLVMDLKGGAVAILDAFDTSIPQIAEGAERAFQDLKGNANAALDDIAAGVKTWASDTWVTLRSSYDEWAEGFAGMFDSWGESLSSWAESSAESLGDWASDMKGAIGDAFSGIVGAVKGPLNDVLGAVETALNRLGTAFIDGLEAIVRPLNPVAFVGDMIPDTPLTWGGITVPRLAAGGIVTSPTLAMIGEAGPEAVVPLGQGGLGGVTVNVYATAVSPADVGREVVEAIEAYERRAGSSWRAA